MRDKSIKSTAISTQPNSLMTALLSARLHHPSAYLGPHMTHSHGLIRVFHPHAINIQIHINGHFDSMTRIHPDGIFEWQGKTLPNKPYLLHIDEIDATLKTITYETYDPYAFPLQISDHDLYLFNEGKLRQTYRTLGAHKVTVSGITGIRFSVWAPNAERVSLVGDFNRWDGRVHPMSVHHSSGVWELFIPGMPENFLYKYEIRNRHTGEILLKTDPYAARYELRPGTAALTPSSERYDWQDTAWLTARADWDWLHAPLNIYEIHAGSWKRHPDGRFYTYRELAQSLLPYIQEMGYTHIELLPISEHPLDESWGYQTTGYFAVTNRYGTPDDFKFFVDTCHQAGVGIILDWVPAHFPQDTFALARFDGTALYEHEDPRLGFHQDWGTCIFNYGRNEIKSFLLSSAHYWLSEFHLDGLRVDAVASMLYLDYSRKDGEWLPNQYGGRENLDAIDFLRELNIMVHEEFPGALTLAEESTAWPAVSRPTYIGGLGFSMKWNMGWMNDTLSYIQQDPIYRRFHHNQLTFSLLYAYTENFILPFSHDEVVHEKGSLLTKMPGDIWQKFANLRLLFLYQITWPGKKLNFMGNEFGQIQEWRIHHELDWKLLELKQHANIQAIGRDLNHLYKNTPALHQLDFYSEGFAWIDCHDADQSVISYLRRSRNDTFMLIVLNFTPVPRINYRIGVPVSGIYHEIFNSDASHYGGSNMANIGDIRTTHEPWMALPDSIVITLPPLAGIMLSLEGT
ncbi:1,4-alpha-glucan branching enzyme [Nitrosomonas cryotolerans]|uniref:1,4-alpha-glucan branching enzyme GlgB n=1 Tax=Nitrosomonas cryotolerans ATCC 49181 TaxID=1131553 RepID=A0A1N6F4L3_9PROT|nr:1,4-alpha-glucan branching protein GlgB [Nitrosomonas cryotolerans]SFP70804.1 1,4-alpha-glucan branching enzyme [Nitrosomonas cryotolerans]SIN90201.1 1,4-alpha-glucan branching enzyme [Nitrosomonas cryotolerans ATCC 49181]